jgi:hypothetical protein
MLYFFFQNIITWIFSITTFGAYGCYFLYMLFAENGFLFVFDKPHYIVEIISILLQVTFSIKMIYSLVSMLSVVKNSWYLLGTSFLLLILSAILESFFG